MSKKINLFRKQAIENITSPEKIGLYIKTSNTSTILTILATSLFVVSLAFWSIFYKIDTIIPIGAVCENGFTECFLNENDFDKIKNLKQINIAINEKTYKVQKIDRTPERIQNNLFSYAMHKSGIKPGDWAFKLTLQTKNLTPGTYIAYLIVNKITPISFVLN